MTPLITEPNTSKRIGATIIDYGFVLTFTYLFIVAYGKPNEDGGYTLTGLPALVPILLWFLYFVLTESIWGSTVGHAIFRLSVLTMFLTKPTFTQILKRRVADIIDIIAFIGLIAFILIRNTQYNQRLGDIWAKTIVVDMNARVAARRQLEFGIDRDQDVALR